MQTKARGFTLIELMLAMTFLAAIMLISSGAIVQAFSIYNKGLIVKQINQVGRTLTEDMTRAANGAAVTDSTDPNTHVLCLGSTVYAWNTPTQADQKKYTDHVTPINFIKTNAASACTSSSAVEIDASESTQLLSDTVRVLYTEVEKASGADNVINITFVFGTYDSDPASPIRPKLVGGQWKCDAGGLGNYCAFGVYKTTLYLPNPKDQT